MIDANPRGPYGREASLYLALRDRIQDTRMPLDTSPRGDGLVACALARIQGREDAGGGGGAYMAFLDGAERELAACCRSTEAGRSVADLFAAVRSAYAEGAVRAA